MTKKTAAKVEELRREVIRVRFTLALVVRALADVEQAARINAGLYRTGTHRRPQTVTAAYQRTGRFLRVSMRGLKSARKTLRAKESARSSALASARKTRA